MGETNREKHELKKDAEDEYQEDPFDPLLREIARDPHAISDSSQALSILPVKGNVIDGKFEIDERLGTGGMGTVFSATHLVTKKRVAIKWMLPAQSIKREAVRRFIREAEAAGRIDHPNVVDVYDFGKHAMGYYLVMELLRGESLSTYLTKHCVYSYKEAIEFLMPVMRGVAAAHAAGVIHRDLKPANIFLCRGADGSPREPKVLDFGISKLLFQPDQPEQAVTTDNTFLGTPSYTAPEQLRGNKTIDCRADIYSLGVILYQLVAGRLPFSSEGFSELLIEITTGSVDPLIRHKPEVPVELNDVVMKAMERIPENRYPDVRSLALALEPFAENAKFDAARSTATFGPSLFTGIKHKRPIALWSTVAFLSALAIAVFLSVGRHRPLTRTRPTIPITAVKAVQIAQRPTPYQIKPETLSAQNAVTPPSETASALSIHARSDVQPASPSIGRKTKIRATENPAKKAAVATREVSFVNSRRAVVKVTLECPQGPIEILLPARNKAAVSVPKHNCRVTCSGAGEPVCPVTFRSNAESLTIY